jgi:hypothetical protein
MRSIERDRKKAGIVSGIRHVNSNYRAGSCPPFDGFFKQRAFTIANIVGNCSPQYLQVYLDFSDPSYNTWFAPPPCFAQRACTNAKTEGKPIPQYLQ